MAASLGSKWRSLSRLYPYIYQHRGRLTAGSVVILLANAFQMLGPRVMGAAVDSLYAGTNVRQLLVYAATVIGLTILEGVCRFGARFWFIGASRDMEYRLREDVFEHLLLLPMSFYQRNKTGELMSRATNDLSNVRMLLGPGIMYSMNTVLTATIAIGFMLSIDWRLTVMALIPLPMVSFGVRRVGRRIHALSEASQAKLAELSARVQESIAGVRVVKAFVQEQSETGEFHRLNAELVQKNDALIRVTSLFYPFMQFLLGLAIAGILWFGGREVVQGTITRGQFVQFIFYLGTLAWPVIALGWVVNIFERGRASLLRLDYILDAETEDKAEAFERVDIRGEVEFRNLTFSYNGSAVLRNVSLHVPSGKTLAIVGATGSGKSSLVQLIPRLYNAPAQSLFIDGVPVENIPLAQLRRAIGFIPQDTFLFGDSLRENIAFGLESSTESAVEYAARVSNLTPDIEGFPSGLSTIVGERGITLSGGQKQRTAISRAVIRDPKILILDDALSSVDTHTEEQILRELRKVMKGRTSILIGHRISTVKEADEIVVLEAGEVVERGTHDSLLQRDGYYAALHRRQLLEEEIEVSD